jgi:hypothetical protein
MLMFLRAIFLPYLTDARVTFGHTNVAASITRKHPWKASVHKVCAVEVGSCATRLLNCKNTEKL